MEKDGKIPTMHVKADSISSAFYKSMRSVHENGYELRTQYDRKNSDGSYMDPPGKDAKVMIEISDLFAEPRFPVASYCERGKYIAEIMGAKDHLVVPREQLLGMIKENEEELSPTIWPYCYHQRLTSYPAPGREINQLEEAVKKLAKDPITRRAIAITAAPEIDLYLKADMPCLRELQFRALEDEQGRLVLNTHATWRSRDLFKAWPDNLIGISNLIKIEVAEELSKKTGKAVIMGPYSETNGSLHIYGQDYSQKGAAKFFENFPDEKSFLERCMISETAKGLEVIPQLNELKEESAWRFTPGSRSIIDMLIQRYESGENP